LCLDEEECDCECEFCGVPEEELDIIESDKEDENEQPVDTLGLFDFPFDVIGAPGGLMPPMGPDELPFLLGDAGIMALAGGPTDMSDLSNFFTSVVITDSAGNVIPPGGNVTIGSNYTFSIRFDEQSTLQLVYGEAPDGTTGVLWYQLPAALQILEPVPPSPIINAAGIVLGTYSISTSGLVIVHFDNVDNQGNDISPVNFIDNYTNAFFTLSITAQLDGNSGNSDLGFGGDTTVNLVPPVEGLIVTKTSYYDDPNLPTTTPTPAGIYKDKLYYEITITAQNADATNIYLMDAPSINGNPLPNDPSTAFINFQYAISTDPTTFYSMVVNWAYIPGSTGGGWMFTYDFGSLVLPANETITVTYYIDVPELITTNPSLVEPDTIMNYSFTIGNQVVATSDIGNGGDTTEDPVHKDFYIHKTGSLENDTSSPPNYWIEWTITVGDKMTSLLNGGSITDNLGVGIIIPTASEINVDFFGQGAATPTDSFTLDSYTAPYSYTITPPSTLTMVMPPDGDTNYGDIYQVVITFRTPLTTPPPKPGQPPIFYDNNVTYTDVDDNDYGSNGNVTLNPPGSVTMTKETSHIYCGPPTNPNLYYVDYTLIVNVPGGLYPEPLSITDVLSMSNGSLVTNNPQAIPGNFSISAVFTGTSTPVTMDPTGSSEDQYVVWYSLITSTNTWQIFFGTTVPPEPAGAGEPEWPSTVSDPVTITIKYTIALSASDVTGLQSGAVLTNTARFQNGNYSNANSNSTLTSSVVRDSWPIIKTATPSPNQPSLFNYKVTINGSNPYPFFLNPNTGALVNPATYSDAFDGSLLEYVPGSIYVVDRNTGIKYYPGTTLSVGSGTISFDFTDLGLPLGPSPPAWYTTNHTYDIYYQLQTIADPADITDTSTPPLSDYQDIPNTATIERGACEFSNNALVSYTKPDPVDKTMVGNPPGSNIVEATIIINPEGINYNVGTLTAQDHVTSGNLIPYTSTIMFYTQTEINPPSGRWDGVWVPVSNPPPSPDTSASPAHWTWYEDSSGDLFFTLPDATPIMITYSMLVDVTNTGTVTIGNRIDVIGGEGADGGGGYTVNDTDANAGGSRESFQLLKMNQDTPPVYLNGAEFQLYIAYLPSNGFYAPGSPTRPPLQVNGYNFYWLMTETTGAGGAVTGTALFEDPYITNTFKYLFMLVETKAPPGYALPTGMDAYSFFVLAGNPFTATEITDLEEIYGDITLVTDNISALNYPAPPVPPGPGGSNGFTGDTSNMLIWQLALLASSLGLICIMMWRKRENLTKQ